MRLVGLRRENFKTLGIKRVPKELPDLAKELSQPSNGGNG